MRPMPMTRLQRLTYRVWFAVGVVLLAAVSLYLAYRPLAIVLAPLLLALLIVYLLNPVVSALERRRVPRLAGTAIAYAGVIAVASGLVVLIVPVLSSQISELASEAPDLGAALADGIDALGARLGLDLEASQLVDGQEIARRLQAFVTQAENRDAIVAVLVGLSGLARGALFVLLTFVVGPVIAFYMLVDLPRFRRALLRVVPPAHRDEVVVVGAKLTTVVGGFVRGQLIIAVLVGVAASAVLGILGLRYWLVVGTIAGVTNLVPLLGPFLAGALGAGIGLLTEGLGFAVLVALAMTAVQQLDSNVLSPLIMGRTVHVHPLAVLLAILVGGVMYGIFGMLVAVPLVAGAKTLAAHLWETRVPWADAARGTGEGEPGAEPPEAAQDAEAAQTPESTAGGERATEPAGA